MVRISLLDLSQQEELMETERRHTRRLRSTLGNLNIGLCYLRSAEGMIRGLKMARRGCLKQLADI